MTSDQSASLSERSRYLPALHAFRVGGRWGIQPGRQETLRIARKQAIRAMEYTHRVSTTTNAGNDNYRKLDLTRRRG